MQQFDIFAQVVASGNIAISARQLDLPVAQVVEAMNGLEDRLGFQLFTVENGLVELTEAGRKAVSALSGLSLEKQERLANELIAGVGPASVGSKLSVQEALLQPEEASDSDHQHGIKSDSAQTGNAKPESAGKLEEQPLAPRHFRPFNYGRQAASQETERDIILASHPAIFTHFQEQLIAFEQASPDINITLRLAPLSSAELRPLFDERLADIAYFYSLEDEDIFNSRYAWSERISLFTGKRHGLARMESASADDLKSIPHVALAPDNVARIIAQEALKKNGLATGVPVLETDDLYQIMKYVETHESYFAAFGALARDFGKMGGIARVAYTQGLPQVHVRQVVRADLADDPAVLALAEFLFR